MRLFTFVQILAEICNAGYIMSSSMNVWCLRLLAYQLSLDSSDIIALNQIAASKIALAEFKALVKRWAGSQKFDWLSKESNPTLSINHQILPGLQPCTGSQPSKGLALHRARGSHTGGYKRVRQHHAAGWHGHTRVNDNRTRAGKCTYK